MSDDLVIMEKQKYLRDHVLDKGYSAESFVTFLQSFREDGDDINTWTMEELKEVVDKFIKMQAPNLGSVLLAEASGEDTENPTTTDDPELSPSQSSEEYKQAVENKAIKESPTEIKTADLPVNELTTKKISIKINGTNIKEGGLFSSAVVYYQIETQPLGWNVSRTFNECLWLRDQLARHFPSSVIPYLDKKGAKTKTESSDIMKRLAWLQKFFDELQRDRTLKSSDILHTFLSFSQRGHFEGKVKEINKRPAPRSIVEIKHLKGTAFTGVTPHKFDLSKEILSYTQTCPNLYKELLKATEDTAKIIRVLSDALARNAVLYKQLVAQYSLIESAEMADLFNTIGKVTESLSDLYNKQATVLQDRFGEFFDYYKEEISSIKEIVMLQENFAKRYAEKEQKLMAKKERLFAEGKPQAWELNVEDIKKLDMSNKTLVLQTMLPRVTFETKELQDLYVTCGYYTNKLLDETRRVDCKNYRTMRKHFQAAAEEFKDLLKDICEKWINVSEHFKTKISKLGKRERGTILTQIRQDLGIESEPVKLLA